MTDSRKSGISLSGLRKSRVLWVVAVLACAIFLTLGGGLVLANAGGMPTVAPATLLVTGDDLDKVVGPSWVSGIPGVANVGHGEESMSRGWVQGENLLGLSVARFSGPLAAKWEVYRSDLKQPSEGHEPRESRVDRVKRMDSAIVLCSWGELDDCGAWMYLGRLGQYVFYLSVTNGKGNPLSESQFNAIVELVEESASAHLN